MKSLLPLAIAGVLVVAGCSSDNDSATVTEPGTFQITFTNLTDGQLMTPPVVALHDSGVHLYQVGETASDAIRDIAEMGSNAALVAFATANPDAVSAAGEAGTAPFGPGNTVSISLTTTESAQVFSAVNMVICTNDGIAGVVTVSAMAYDAGTRMNQADAQSFFPPPCKTGDTVEAPVEDPRASIVAHPGQSGLANVPDGSNWNFAAGEGVLQIEIVRN